MQFMCSSRIVIAIYRGNMSDLAVFQIHLFCYKEYLNNLLVQIIIVRYDKIITLG